MAGCKLMLRAGWSSGAAQRFGYAVVSSYSGAAKMTVNIGGTSYDIYTFSSPAGGSIELSPGDVDYRIVASAATGGRNTTGANSRLAGVVIECLDFEAFLRRYDSPGTLFYLDPPYWGSEGDYGKALFGRGDFERLAGALRGLKGRFLMSINDVPEIRAMFAWARIEEVKTTYTIAGKGAARPAAELLISGGAQ